MLGRALPISQLLTVSMDTPSLRAKCHPLRR